jgi:tetratricopeptide (TPR) repeat protein
MRAGIGAVVLVALLGALGYVAWPLVQSGFRVGGPPSPLESRWKTEEQWLVDTIVRDLAEMARFAADQRNPAPAEVDVTVATTTPPGVGPVNVAVTLGPGRRVERELPLASFVWSPHEYRPLGRALLNAAGGPASTGTAGKTREPLLAPLTDLRAAVIERLSRAVSQQLAKDFADSALHESAALLLGAFALREAAAEYADTRATLCRMTAHLALAGALRQDAAATLDGRVAMAVLLVLGGRGADAARALEDLARGPEAPGLAAWRRALHVRLTDDARSRPPDATFLERRELYGAMLRSGDGSAAERYAQQLGMHGSTDAWRLVAEVQFSVETGHALLPAALDLELREIREVWGIAHGTPLADDALTTALNHPAARCLTAEGPQVIGWGTWAAAFQRHLVACLMHRLHHLRQRLAAHVEADRELRAAERYSGLTLYPMVETRGSTDGRRRPRRLDDLITLMIEQPELINAVSWYAYSPLARDEVVRRGMPSRMAWFTPSLPRGTTFDVRWRRFIDQIPVDPKQLGALSAISPQDFHTVDALVERQFGERGEPERAEALYGERALYDKRVFERLSTLAQRDVVALERILRRACAQTGGECYSLGYLLVERGDLAGAAEAYQRGFDLDTDSIRASNSCAWLVKHYLDTGRRDRASAVAEAAAATGSGRGLQTMARYLERTGDFEGAERFLKQAFERYRNRPQYPAEAEESQDAEQDEDTLLAFYYRMARERKQAAYEERFLELASDDFPAGVERAELAAFSGYPADGVAVLRTWPLGERAGLKAGDVIVALDGYRVRTRRQYLLVRGFTDDPEMSLILFRHPRYLALELRRADRYLGVDMRSQRTGGPSSQGR